LSVVRGDLPEDFSAQADAYIQECQDKMEKVASRKASQNCLNAYGPMLPELLGGSADLAGSNLTIWSGSKISAATMPTATISITACVNLV